MGVITYKYEEFSTIAPARLFKSFFLDAHNLIPKVLPGVITSYELVEGDGGAGSIVSITFGEGSHSKRSKHRVDEIDIEKSVYKYSIIEGDVLGDAFESISYVVKVEPGPEGGSVCKTESSYHTKKEGHHISEERFKEGKEKAKAILKAVEAHLHGHPHEYI